MTEKHRKEIAAEGETVEEFDEPETGAVDPLIEYLPKRSLRTSVATVSVSVLTLTAVVFFWLAWAMSGAEAPWNGNGIDWIEHVQPGHWVSAAISVTAMVVALCLVVFAALALRRQDVAEHAFDFNVATHETALRQVELSAEAQRIAEWQADLSRAQGQIDRKRVDLESERLGVERDFHRSAREAALRQRFADSATLLSSEQIPVRLAGVYGLASLADDWHDFGDDAERQACVSLLCDQLRLVPSTSNEFEVNRTIVALIRAHRPVEATGEATWADCSLDLSAAYIPGVNLIDTNLTGVMLFRTNLAGASLANSVLDDVSATHADFDRANLVGASMCAADLRWSKLTNCLMTGSDLTRAELQHAELASSDLTKAKLGCADVSGAVLDTANLSEATLYEVVSDSATRWPATSGFAV